ncbi:MAG TPA: TIGR03013 family XrtA/PEP-CTERM system glycosyltransferase [Blastocatellia bacterium]
MRKLFLITTETALLYLSGLVAAYVRLGDAARAELLLRHGWLKLVVVVLTVQLSFYLFDLYDLRVAQKNRLLVNFAKSYAVSTVSLIAVFYVVPSLLLGRGIFILNLVLGAALTLAFRLVDRLGERHPNLVAKERVLILGSGKLAIEVARATLERPGSGFSVVGFVDDKPELLGKSLINPCMIGLNKDLEQVVGDYRVDRIVVAVEDRRGNFPTGGLLNLRLSGRVAVEESACYYERLTGRIATQMVRPSWLIFSDGGRYSDFEHRLRRVANMSLAAIGTILSLPIMAIVAIVVKLESKGPVLFFQERVGQNGKVFQIVKFRSMRVDAEDLSGPVWASVSDPRVTRVGRIIRKTRLDELPQFFNVLKGDMNFVGPRPERPTFVEELGVAIPYYSQRHLVKPGLTGWAQIRYPYGASMEEAAEKLQFDLYYIKNQSWLLDAIIIFETVKIVLFGRGAR